MLLSFSVANFRSIQKEAILSMSALSRIKEHQENTFPFPGKQKEGLLKSLVIYGANASGKSNIFKAFRTLFLLIQDGSNFGDGRHSIGKYYEPFMGLQGLFSPTKLSIQFLALSVDNQKQVLYEYAIAFDNFGVHEESLYFNPKGQRAKIFERKNSEVTFGEYFTKGNSFFKDALKDEANKEKVLLSWGLTLGLEEFKAIRNFVQKQVWWSDSTLENLHADFLEKELMEQLESKDKELTNRRIKALIKSLDTGIEDIGTGFADREYPGMKPGDQIPRILETIHPSLEGKLRSVFKLSDESEGTQRLIRISLPILNVLEKGGLIIIDEIDRSLHPKIVEYLFKIFNDPSINTKNAQLIATTHSAMIMQNDLFRRDQIVIAERGDDGASTYYNLAEVRGLRAGVPFERYYYAGMLGGTPDINDVDFRAEFL